ncbi:DUF2971 domain-containing protein [Ekhidna sp.]|uniref:DUF2971 domain-containing protein n=1 Tax=Ekhidna sp. TaxID=2608089 RepID=UPI003C7A4D9B
MNDSYENKWIEHHFDIVKDFFSETRYDKLIKDSFDMYEWNSKPPFIFCLSANKDLLSQWRAYSHDGQGVAIGFSTKHLNIKNELPAPNVYAHNTLGIEKVEYYNYSQKNKVIELCKDVKEAFDKDPSSDDNIMLSLDLAFSLVNWGLIFKNPSFKEEREWRIIHTPTDSYEEPLNQLSDLKFRINSNRITTYYSYNFDKKFNSDLIKEIVIGPRCQMKLEEIEQFLKHNNLSKTRVIMSKSTYR